MPAVQSATQWKRGIRSGVSLKRRDSLQFPSQVGGIDRLAQIPIHSQAQKFFPVTDHCMGVNAMIGISFLYPGRNDERITLVVSIPSMTGI